MNLDRQHQTIMAAPGRDDGNNADGVPGDCLRTAVACLLRIPAQDVPHFVLVPHWWVALRNWTRCEHRQDFAWLDVTDNRIDTDHDIDTDRVIGTGPSPRGTFWHCVILDPATLEMVHDPHPSGAGLQELRSVLVLTDPYDPAPPTYSYSL